MTRPSDVSLYCEIQGSGPDLVVLHPAGLNKTFMSRLVQTAAASHRVLGIDLCGHGRSPDAPEGMTLSSQAFWVSEAMKKHGMGAATVLGLSLGGMVAQTLALEFPASVGRLVLCGCTGGFNSDLQPLLLERGLSAQREGMQAVVGPTLQRWFSPAFLTHAEVSDVAQCLLQNKPSNWLATWRAISNFNALPRLSEIKVPTLVLAGDQDTATPLAATETLTRAISGAKRVVLQGAPHMMQIETHALFNQAVMSFLNESK
jgi:3-oxoadipate enol-lactonase